MLMSQNFEMWQDGQTLSKKLLKSSIFYETSYALRTHNFILLYLEHFDRVIRLQNIASLEKLHCSQLFQKIWGKDFQLLNNMGERFSNLDEKFTSGFLDFLLKWKPFRILPLVEK